MESENSEEEVFICECGKEIPCGLDGLVLCLQCEKDYNLTDEDIY